MFENVLVIYFKYENLPMGVQPCTHTHTHTHTRTHTTSLLPAHFMRKKKRTVKHVKS